MKKILIGFFSGICLILLSGYVILLSGGIPVATKGEPFPFERYFANKAIHIAIGQEVNKKSPLLIDEINMQNGAKVYMNSCAVCHGGLGGQLTSIAKGLFPKPPQLLELDDQIIDDPIGEVYWKVKNGIRLTGMPGFIDSLSETEIWQVSQLLTNVNKISVETKSILITNQK
ncbi:MAG: cytochrome c [Bdellovibrionaceae bacterium]|nr:cytochrome c [Pseudobdellovibrionaceae bacterium]